MEKLIECVPNFSEGRNKNIIEKIADSISSVPGIKLLHKDSGYDANRTVITFTGSPESVKLAAFNSIKTAAELIDMRKQKGTHPRIGAADVFPFIPLSGISDEKCVLLSKEVAEQVGQQLSIPVYLYEKSASSTLRKNLSAIRKGEYESFAGKMRLPEWKPDFGPQIFNEKTGATVIGVRDFLIAYNINLDTPDKKIASEIALLLREKGYTAKPDGRNPLVYSEGFYPAGFDNFKGKTIAETTEYCREKSGFDLRELLIMNDINPEKPEGHTVKLPGKFKNCKAIGWYIPEYKCAQVSINLTNYKVTSMHHVFEETKKLAAERGVSVTGSELIGLVPYKALVETGKFYLSLQKLEEKIPEREILNEAIKRLGLNQLSGFKIETRVLGLPADFS